MVSTKSITLVSAVLILGSVSTADAYVFDSMCAPETDHVVGADAPNLFFVLDASGSMNSTSTDPMLSRWEAAVLAVDEVVTDVTIPGPCTTPGDPTCDPLRFGIGFFSTGAYSAVAVQEDANIVPTPTISAALAAAGPPPNGQYTEVGDAGKMIKDEVSLQDPTRSNVAVMISDGGPTDSGGCFSTTLPIDQTIRFIENVCEARNRGTAPVQTYVVGFGTDASSDTNSLFAAAGGTGTCCLTSDCAGEPRDPCSMSETDLRSHLTTVSPTICRQAGLLSSLACTGSIEATSPADLKAALLGIAGSAACTFPLDIPSAYPFPGAQADPTATRVLIEHTFSSAFTPPGQISIPNIGDPASPSSTLDQDLITLWGVPAAQAANYKDEGWFFSDVNRQFVTLTPQLCTDIVTSDLTRVKTQVACACVKAGPCTAIDLSGFTPSQLSNMRCGVGTWQCVAGEDVCVAAGDPYPEICNGLDDDCDGMIDNIFESWQKPEHMSYVIPPDHAGIACGMRTTCMCDNGWQDPISGDTWDAMLDGSTGTCMCGEGLSYEEPQAQDAPESSDFSEPQACSSAPASPRPVPWLLLSTALALGLVSTRKRR